MSLDLDKETWKSVRLGDVIRRSRRQVDPLATGVERYVAGGDIDGDAITIQRSSAVSDGQIGSTFRYVFEPGDVLFVSARPYLRKTGVVDFTGVVADKTYVLRANPGNGLLQELLPFVLSSERFVRYATTKATGSMNPRLLWGPFQDYDLALPPLDEQKRIADLLWASEEHRNALGLEAKTLVASRRAAFACWLEDVNDWSSLGTQFDAQLGKMLSAKSHITDDDRGVPYLANINVRWNSFDMSNLRYVRLNEKERTKFALRPGDVLVCEGGEIGRAAIWDGRIDECYYQKALHRLRPTDARSLPGPLVVAYLELLASDGRLNAHSTGTTFAHLTRERLVEIEIPFASPTASTTGMTVLSRFDRAIDSVASELDVVSRLHSSLLADVFGDR